MKYRIVFSTDELQFTNHVEQLLKEGYRLIGGMCPIVGSSGWLIYTQTLVKE